MRISVNAETKRRFQTSPPVSERSIMKGRVADATRACCLPFDTWGNRAALARRPGRA